MEFAKLLHHYLFDLGINKKFPEGSNKAWDYASFSYETNKELSERQLRRIVNGVSIPRQSGYRVIEKALFGDNAKNNQFSIALRIAYEASKKYLIINESNVLKIFPDEYVFIRKIIDFDRTVLKKYDQSIIDEYIDINEAKVDDAVMVWFGIPNSWRVIIDRRSRSIMGYWHIVPLTEKFFSMAINGKFVDNMIMYQNLEPFIRRGEVCDIYIAFMGYDQAQTMKNIVFHEIMTTMLDVLDNLAFNNEILIRNVCANGLTKMGAKACLMFGMRNHNNIVNEFDRGKIYTSSMREILIHLSQDSKFIRNNYARLISYYSEMMRES